MANCITVLVTLWFASLILPESPSFLFERCKFDELRDCLIKISFTNGCYSTDTIEHGMRKLKN